MGKFKDKFEIQKSQEEGFGDGQDISKTYLKFNIAKKRDLGMGQISNLKFKF